MRTYSCVCGQRLFSWNTVCLRCSRELGFDPDQLMLLPLEAADAQTLRRANGDSNPYRHCANREHGVCNWLTRAESSETLCLSCSLNEVIPNLSSKGGRERWKALEEAKRALLVTLLTLGLPVVGRHVDPAGGLAFAFRDDRESNPNVVDETVVSGHDHGLITINAREADAAERERIRRDLSEPYRTLLGHFRHESGHYYWFRLVDGSELHQPFRALFGDESVDYQGSLSRYYVTEPHAGWRDEYVSAYASAHPHEDWAESWAHYLHLTDTMETAREFGLLPRPQEPSDFGAQVEAWLELSVALNALNRSMGIADAYPFVLSERVVEKLAFVSRVASGAPARGAAAADRSASS